MRRLCFRLGLVAIVALIGCSPNQSVSHQIAAEAAKSKTIDLAKLAGVPWDQAFIFGPYAPTARICTALPASWKQCATSYPTGTDEGSYLLVFVREDVVVHHEIHRRSKGEFCYDSCLLKFTPKEASFNVNSASVGASGVGTKRFSRIAD
jgi:hypothetical protein